MNMKSISLIVTFSLMISGWWSGNLNGQSTIYLLKQPIITQHNLGDRFAYVEQELNHVLTEEILSYLNQSNFPFDVNQSMLRLDSLDLTLRGFNNIDPLTLNYYLGLVQYGKWLLHPSDNITYQGALNLFNTVINDNPAGGTGDIGIYYYSAAYLKGLLYLQHYWNSPVQSESDLRNGIENLHQAIDIFSNVGNETIQLKYSAQILIAWASIERCFINPVEVQMNINLQDAENMLSSKFGNNTALLQIKYYLLATVKYIRSAFSSDNEIAGLLQSVNFYIDKMQFDGNSFPGTFTEAALWARFVNELRSQFFTGGSISTTSFTDPYLKQKAKFYKNLVQSGLTICGFAPITPGDSIPNDPEFQFWNNIISYLNLLNNGTIDHILLQPILSDLDNFINNNQSHPVFMYARFFKEEVRFFENFSTTGNVPALNSTGLQGELFSWIERRRLLDNILNIDFIFQAAVNWADSTDPFVILITSIINDLGININNLSSFDLSAPITTLFSLARIRQNYWFSLINLLSYLHHNSSDITLKQKLSILIGYAIHRSNITDEEIANESLTWLNNTSVDTSIEAERKLAAAIVRYYGLPENEQAFQLLREINDRRARDLLEAWQVPGIPPTSKKYDFIGFDIIKIDQPGLIVCDYDYTIFNPTTISYTSYTDILTGLFINRPYNFQLFSLYPIPFLRFALNSNNQNQNHISGLALMKYLSSGVNVGRRIPITFHFPKAGADFTIIGEVNQTKISEQSIQYNLPRFTPYKIICDLDGYLKYSDNRIFTRKGDVRLDTLMEQEKLWRNPRSYTLPDHIFGKSESFFIDIDIDQKNRNLAFLVTSNNRYFFGIQKNEINRIENNLVTFYQIPTNVEPTALSFDRNNYLYISDILSDNIWIVNVSNLDDELDLQLLEIAGLSLNKPSDLFVYQDSLYISNSGNGSVIQININNFDDYNIIQNQSNEKPEFFTRTANNFYIGTWQLPQQSEGSTILSLQNIWGIKPFISSKDYIYFGNILDSSVKIFCSTGEQVSSFKLTEMDFPLAIYRTASAGFIAGKDKILIYDLK